MNLRDRARAVERLGPLVSAVPSWFWLASLVLLSASIRLELALADPAPWIFTDELIYSELAKSFAATGDFALRDVPGTAGYGRGYPFLIAPAFALFNSVPDAYEVIKAINAVVMSLAAVPAYLLARRLVGAGLAFLGAVLTVAVPSLVYTSLVMTENAFYPVFLFAAYALVLVCERPTVLRQLSLLALVAVAYQIRPQALVLVPATVLAVVLTAGLEAWTSSTSRLRAFFAGLRSFWVTGLTLAVGVIGFVVLQAARGRSPLDTILGAYRVAAERQHEVREITRWFVFQLAGLDLYVGVLPFAAFIVVTALALKPAAGPGPLRAFAVSSVSLVVCFLLAVSAFVDISDVKRIEERNLFYLGPLFLVALLVWLDAGLPRPPAIGPTAALMSAALVGAIPYFALIGNQAVSDTFALLPLWTFQDGLASPLDLPAIVVLGATAVALAFLFLPARLSLLAPVAVLTYFLVAHGPVEHFTGKASRDSLRAGIWTERDWIDRIAGPGANVATIYTGRRHFAATWENEFFNRTVRSVYNFGLFFDGLPQTQLSIEPETGRLLDPMGDAVTADYLLVDTTVLAAGRGIAQDPVVGMMLYATAGPLRILQQVEGVHQDFWSGSTVTYSRYACERGTVTVEVSTDSEIHREAQTVVAAQGAREVASTTVPVGAVAHVFVVPVEPEGGLCQIVFTVEPTAVPAQVAPPSNDTRELGVRFLDFSYRPASGG